MAGKKTYLLYSLQRSEYLSDENLATTPDIAKAWRLGEGRALDLLVAGSVVEDPWKGYVLLLAPEHRA